MQPPVPPVELTSEMKALASMPMPPRAARAHGERGWATAREKDLRGCDLRAPRPSCRADPIACTDESSTLSTHIPAGSAPPAGVGAACDGGGGGGGAYSARGTVSAPAARTERGVGAARDGRDQPCGLGRGVAWASTKGAAAAARDMR